MEVLLHLFVTIISDGGQWEASVSSRSISSYKSEGTQSVGICMGSRGGLKQKILRLPVVETQSSSP
jgi:hypothetical protein